MRAYLLSVRERKILQTYVEEGVKLDGFSVLAIRLRRAEKNMTEDFELIEKALRRMDLK
jgi:hypothetical protein